MWPFTKPISLIRYLVVWRVNSSLAVLPRHFSPVLSKVLGTMIAQRLPTREANAWREALDDENDDPAWPIEAVLFPYGDKMNYGRGEPILWELKLMGASADHGLFLELILPAMEEAASTTDSRWHRHNWLWGNFDIQAIYAARGQRWEPLVTDGHLSLDYRPTPAQWAEGLTFGQDTTDRFHTLTWVTPFTLGQMADALDSSYRSEASIEIPVREVPTIPGILDAMMTRIINIVPTTKYAIEDVQALLDLTLASEEQTALREGLRKARRISRHQTIRLESAQKGEPGRWIGTQRFRWPIPQALAPYMQLASILHVGEETHFGCGTFRLS